MGFREAWNGLIGRQTIVREKVMVHDSDRDRGGHTVNTGPGRTKYGNLNYNFDPGADYAQLRENGRGVYQDSLLARSIVGRLVDNVINVGLTPESSPLWRKIKAAESWSDEQKNEWIENTEDLWTLYANSKEADYRGRTTFKQLQRLVYHLWEKEGETFVICRYRKMAGRTNPLCLQILNNDQIQTPFDSDQLADVEEGGGKVQDGIEYDSDGKMVAIYVKEDLDNWDKDLIRFPVWSNSGQRRFVIHCGNFETADQFRGFPELAAMVYELDRLVEYDIGEIEAAVNAAAFMAFLETAAGATKKKPNFAPAGGDRADDDSGEVKEGIERMSYGSRALFMTSLAEGQQVKFPTPGRPNPNYEKFVLALETRIANAIGMPLSVVHQKFQASYSAARAEILFFWNSVMRRRDDFIAGFLSPVFEAWFSEHVRTTKKIEAPGYEKDAVARLAWLYGSWNGISRPVVDPVKEATSAKMREEMFHTTGERNAKEYNGSDYRENVKRRKNEIAEGKDAIGEVAETTGAPGLSESDELKTKLDLYGVGVRAGSLTPTIEDEEHFRAEAGLPALSENARAAWSKENNVRRPITLTQPGEESPQAPPPDDTGDDESAGDDDTEREDEE